MIKIKKKENKTKKSFYFEEYRQSSENNFERKFSISHDRIYLLFFIFFSLIFMFAIKIITISLQDPIGKYSSQGHSSFKLLRNDIMDRNGVLIARNIRVYHAAIKPGLIKDKKKFILKLKILYPNLDFNKIEKNISEKKYFYFKQNVTEDERLKLWSLGEKGLLFETSQTRIYPHKNLFSHVVGQIDLDNKGISGLEKSFDKELKSNKKEPMMTTLDINLQFLIREELIKFQKIFKSIGSASILMDVNSGEILSMTSLPDFDLNKRETTDDVNYINRATKGVYELGSVFKTFTLAGALNEGMVKTNTEFKNLPKKITCAGKPIGEYDNKIPSDLTAEQILIRSGIIGSVRIGQKVGEEKMRNFLQNIGVLSKIEFDIEEVGEPIPFRWGKCKLATASFGHGITTTLLQLAKGYSIISNGGFNIKPTLIKRKVKESKKIRILNKDVSKKINPILRKIVSTKEGTANFANIEGYQVGGKTGTAQKSFNGVYSKNKINTFVAVFPTSKPKYILLVLLDEPKPSRDYIYHYKDGSGWKYKGTPYNTAGWTSVEIAGKIIEKIGPILAINKIDFYDNHVAKKSY